MGKAGLGPARADADPGPLEFSPVLALGGIVGRSLVQSRSRSNPTASGNSIFKFHVTDSIAIARKTTAGRNTAVSHHLRSNCATCKNRPAGRARIHTPKPGFLGGSAGGNARNVFLR